MQRLKRLAQGTLSKQKLAALQRIFDAATTQKWFDNSEYSQEGFAVVLIGLSAFGLAGSKLELVAWLWAFNEFSHDMSNAQRAKLKAHYCPDLRIAV
ncbi:MULTISPECIES: hypothetical protein [unclassified Rhizobium]|uniref:hypothetical protein n=1 Tax=unclassified Rhizobium TaxID=2613769 RepID=UPI003828D37C